MLQSPYDHHIETFFAEVIKTWHRVVINGQLRLSGSNCEVSYLRVVCSVNLNSQSDEQEQIPPYLRKRILYIIIGHSLILRYFYSLSYPVD